MRNAVLETDILIIGSGFGGSVAAARLTEAGRDVVMLERGPWRDTLPVASMNVRDRIALPRVSWLQTLSKTLSIFIGRRLTRARGLPFNRRHGMYEISNHRGLFSLCTNQVGGGSLAWSGAVSRPLRPDYWDGRAEGVSEQVMAPHFDRVWDELETTTTVPSHGGAVDWAKEFADREWMDFSLDFEAGWAHRLPGDGRPETDSLGIRRAESNFTEHLSLGCLDGSKASSESIWLGPAVAKGLKLVPSCEVMRIRRTDAGYQVDAQRTSGELILQVHCRRLLLGAGTSNTLRLLMEAEQRGELEAMPALGQRISGNGDEMAFLWNARASQQEDVRTGLGSMFHVQGGSRDVLHGLLETDLPRPRWRLLRRLMRPLLNCLLVVGMGPDGSGGRASLVRRRLQIDFDAAATPANQTGRDQNAETAKRLGMRAFFLPKAFTVHLCGGATVGESAKQGVVDGYGECWTNPGLYVVDAAAIPEAPGRPPSLNIAAWASHVAKGIAAREFARDKTTVRADNDSQLTGVTRRQLAALFALLPHDRKLAEELAGTSWQARRLARVKGRCPRQMRFDIEHVSESLQTLEPSASAFPGAVPASAWDGSGLCWQWRGETSGQMTDVQLRSLPDFGHLLARVRQHDGREGWYLLSREAA